MSLKTEFVLAASQEGANVKALCAQYGIGRDTAYRLLNRYREEGPSGLEPRSRRPKRSPTETSAEMQDAIVRLREAHPAWGPRKLKAYLERQGLERVPAPSTIADILSRRGLVDPEESAKHRPFQRFEHEAPNDLWQMDFKGHFELPRGRCNPLTVLDDHSRFSLCLSACADQRGETVKARLTEAFRAYGLPKRMTMDNGSPWGSDADHPHTAFTLWLVRLGVRVSHSRPYHPQTQGKDERFHRTLKAELLEAAAFREVADLVECQRRFDRWRDLYNLERPHQALGFDVPASRYRPSPREFPEALPEYEYPPGDDVRKVYGHGWFDYRGRRFKMGKAFRGLRIALRPTERDGIMEVYYCAQKVATVDLHLNIFV
jgi:transposase InsO family protein